MITSYSGLQTSILNHVHRPNDSALVAVLPELIYDAETRIYNELRIKEMETAYSATIASGVVAVPDGCLEWKFLYIDGSDAQKLTRRDPEWIYTNYPSRSAGGKPLFFAREGGNLIFGAYPDSAYTVKGVYYKRLDALSDTNTSNWLITDAPDLIRSAALCEVALFVRDLDLMQVQDMKYERAKARVIKADMRESLSGSRLSMVRG